MEHSHLARFLTIQNILFFGLLAFGTVAFIWLIQDFIMPIFWAVVLAIVFNPVQNKWLAIIKNKTASSVLTLLTIVIILFVPLWVVGGLVVQESLDVYSRFSSESIELSHINFTNHTNGAFEYLETYGIKKETVQEKLTTLAQAISGWLARQAIVFGQATFSVVIGFLLMMYVLFFLLRDGPKIGKTLFHILPLGDEREEGLFINFTLITRSIFKGTLVIAVLQGTVGGVLFWIAGINGVLLWATIMTLLSVIPAIGPAIIWLPAGILLVLSGALWQGILILVGGVVIISLIDNILRPILVGRDVKIPDAIILISTLGGLTLFGITGFIIGPIIAGFFLSMWKIFEVDYRDELETQG
ncbi:AI-2E family transporter [Candidatus Kaiserbacteria bacterium]|nr:AI-2E family transporter [Candidatus Kaiserbacteria bacterium]